MRNRIGLGIVAALAVFSIEWPARAAHHLWRLERAFSSADGTVQFVELATTDGTETQVGGQTVVGDGTFTFASNLTGSTTNTWLLLATANFQARTGLTPDGVLPAGFLTLGGGSLNYASGVDTWTYGALPTDDKTMLVRNPSTNTTTTAAAVATNFAGQSVSVNLSPAVPALPRWAIAACVGLVLLAGSGLLRRQRATEVA